MVVDTDRKTTLAMDPVTFEVLKNRLINATEEMGVTIRRSAYSTNIKTRADFSCAFFDQELRCIAQSYAQPAHLVSMATIVPNAIQEYGADNLRPGDAILVNDPHRGSSHLNDVACISPVILDGQLIGYVANMAHHVDIGGSAPGSLGNNKEIYQEGLVISPICFARNDEIDPDILRLILSNIRAPKEVTGDLLAQLSANHIGKNRVEEIVGTYPPDLLSNFCDELIQHTKRWTEAEIFGLPRGSYFAEAFRDDDGFSEEPIKVCVRVQIDEKKVLLDLTGSETQRLGSINCTRTMSACGLAFVVKCLIDKKIEVNSGFLDTLEVLGPDGLVCTAVKPAAVVGGWEMGQLVTELIFKALQPALSQRIPACGKALMVNLAFEAFNPQRGEKQCYMETIAGGNGARPSSDGPDAVQTNLHNTENAPIEEVELNYPVRISRYELIQDSCGSGTYRGGLGLRRDLTFPYSNATFTMFTDGCKFRPWGIAGGTDGGATEIILNPDGENRKLSSKFTCDIPAGTCISVRTPGGGGFGDASDRKLSSIQSDLLDEKISLNHARKFYPQWSAFEEESNPPDRRYE